MSPRRSITAALLLLAVGAAAQEGVYPLIGSLDRSDVLFHQIESDVEAFHYTEAHPTSDAVAPPLMVFRYRLKAAEDLGVVAARLGIGQATLATLNRASTPAEFVSQPEVLVANIPGLFIPDTNRTEFESGLAAARARRLESAPSVLISRGGQGIRGHFFPGDVFSPAELAGFYRGFFRSPIVGGRVSSRFGSRLNPFGGGSTLHGGIDIVAPKGTPILAAQSGTITEVGASGRYGNYVTITHSNGYQTMYAHLQKVFAVLRATIESGSIIGTLGDTGLTTGAHLHFEIRWKGVPVDPLLHLPAEWRQR